MKIKTAKIIIIIFILTISLLEGLYLFCLPAILNKKLNSNSISITIKEKTGLDFKCNNIKLKTYPDFSLRITANEISIKDINKVDIVSSRKIDTVVYLPDIIFKKISIVGLKTDKTYLSLTRKKDKNFYLGRYKIVIPDKKNNLDIELNGIKIRDTLISFNDELVNKKIDFNIPSADFYYKKKRTIGLIVNSDIIVNNTQKSKIQLKISSKLPFEKGLNDKKFVCNGSIINLDLSDFSPYFKYFVHNEITSADGIINAEFKKNKNLKIDGVLKNFSIKMKNNLDNLNSNSDIKFSSIIDFKPKTLVLSETVFKASDWNFNIKGNIKDYTSKNLKEIKTDLDVKITDSNINSLYWLTPSIKGDPRNVIQKFKKYGVWGIVNGSVKIKGSASNPEFYGKIEAEDVYIVKNNPLVQHCKVYAEFLKDNVKIKTRVFAGHGEYVDVDGTAEMKFIGKGNFHIVSSPNVDLSTAEYMLVPVHEVVGFDLGPVPYMDIKGKGNIDIYTKGTVIDGEVTGRFNFMNTTARLEGLNTTIHKANGALVFDKQDMHFYTNSAYINNKPVKIDGKANLDGHIDFDITTKSLDLSELLDILNTSKILESRKIMASPLEKAYGTSNTKIKITGIVKDFSTIATNKTLNISGILDLINVNAKLKQLPLVFQKINGKIEFDNSGWKVNLKANEKRAKINAHGFANQDKIDLKFSADKLNTDEILNCITKEHFIKNISSMPQTNSLISLQGEYKSPYGINETNFAPKYLQAKGYFTPINQKTKQTSGISSGNFEIKEEKLVLKSFHAKLYDSNIFSNLTVSKIFSPKPVLNGIIHITNFDIKSLNTLKSSKMLPASVQKLLNAYKDYQGNANIFIKCNNNSFDGYIDFKDVKFTQAYFNTPVIIDSGKIILKGSKIEIKSIIARVDNTPVFLNFAVWDLDKTMRFKGYFTTKLTDYFTNKYINNFLTYPLKPKGDITLTVDLNGNTKEFNVHPEIKFAKEADIYYMGANLGDVSNERKIFADIKVKKNIYYIKRLNYVRYMISQNDKIYPITIFTSNGTIEEKGKNLIYLKDLSLKTVNNASVKIFNFIFKKSVLKNGMFNCDLKINGYINKPLVNGYLNISNAQMPIYDTTIKNLLIRFKGKNIELESDGKIYNSDLRIKASAKNTLEQPFVVDKLDINSDELNLDTFIDSLTKIPTPDTTTKMTGASNKKSIPFSISDIEIKNGSMNVKDIIIRGLPAKNYTSEFKLGKNMLLEISKLWFDVTTGRMTGTASYNFSNGTIKANVSALNVDSNEVASKLFDFKDQIYGQSNGTIIMTTRGSTEEDRIKNMSGYVYFEIADGKMPKLGSVEYLLKAGNFIKSGITGISLSNLIDLLTPIKTGHFDSIKGNFAMKNGVAQNIEIYSKGDNLNIYINGEYDILQQYADLRVFGRLTKKASNILGAVGNLSFNSLLNTLPGFKLGASDKQSLLEDLNKIPGVELSDQKYRIFTVKIDGKINEEKFVKNFRWIE